MKKKNTTMERLKKSNCATDKTFFQAVEEVVESLQPVLDSNPIYERHAIMERLTTPDRQFKFKVVWMDDNQKIQVNTGYRIQFNNALGPYKGGLRFHPSVNGGILKFLSFEQIFKNSLTGLPIGGGKGGSDFDPKGKSDFEVMKFCSAYMTELHKYIGPRIDVPAGDIGVGGREIGYLFGEYKKITSSYEGILTGKPFMFGGSLMRPQATGYGTVYFTDEMLKYAKVKGFEGRICTVSGAGNVAIYTIEKLYDLGAKPVTCSDSRGTIYDSRGIDLELLKELKLNQRASLEKYCETNSDAIYTKVEDYPEDGHHVWSIECDCAFPCATQNELTGIDAQTLIKNGCISVSEGANMPSTPEAIEVFHKNKILFAPAKAANAGGVAVSEFEMSQNAAMAKWTYETVDARLEKTMRAICKRVHLTAEDYGVGGNYVDGANIAGFKRVADAMIAEGI
ncbi:MAG: NADP-specific glutamate dehydrogenase [Campylobacterota bacterium]|nr:NADP-specific glutamate dehydrogenase [Campylobacterota bacterium]